MMEMLLGVLKWSLAAGTVTLAVTAVRPLLDRHFLPKWRYWLWAVLAFLLILSPVQWEKLVPVMPKPAVTVEAADVRIPVPHRAPSVQTLPDVPPESGASAGQGTLSGQVVPSDTDPLHTPPAVPAERDMTFSDGVRPNAVETPAEGGIELSAVLTFIWLAGAVVFIIRRAVGTALIRRRALRWSVPAGAEVLEAYVKVCADLAIRRVPPLTVSRGVTSPMAVGLLRPRLLLPDRDYGERELGFILRHELTHIKRRDLWYKALMLLSNAMHWFDPLIWLMRREADETVELLCDAEALRGADVETRRAYCET